MRIVALLLILLLSAMPALAQLKLNVPNSVWQNGGVITGAGKNGLVSSPPGKPGQIYVSGGSQPGKFVDATNSSFPLLGGVSSFGANVLSPLFTVGVTNPTTTPVLSFTLSSAAAHTFLGTGSGTTPSYVSIGLSDLPSTVVANVGNLSPLFTTSDSAQTLTFSPISVSSATLFGNFGSTSAAPSFNASGSNDQILGVVHSSTGLEYKSVVAGRYGTRVVPTAGQISINGSPYLPQAYALVNTFNSGYEVVSSQDGLYAYVAGVLTSSGDGAIAKISLIDGSIVGTLDFGSTSIKPNNLAINPDGASLYATDANTPTTWWKITTSSMTIAHTATLATAISTTNPQPFDLSNDGVRYGYISGADQKLYLINTTTFVQTNFTVNHSAGAANTSGVCAFTTTSIPVGTAPEAVAVTPNGLYAYVANAASNTVSVIDTTTNAIVGSPITVGSFPDFLAITPDGLHVYVSNSLASTVSVISTASNTVVATVTVGFGSGQLAITPNGAYVYVPTQLNNVQVIDTSTNTVVANVVAGTFPRAIAVTPNGLYAYVTDATGNAVSVITIASNTVTAGPIAVGNNPRAISITPDGLHAYVSNVTAGTVSVITTASNTVTATLAIAVGTTAITSDSLHVYGTSGNTVLVIDTGSNTVSATISSITGALGIAIVPSGNFAYVTNSTTSKVTGINIPANTIADGTWEIAYTGVASVDKYSSFGGLYISTLATGAAGTPDFGPMRAGVDNGGTLTWFFIADGGTTKSIIVADGGGSVTIYPTSDYPSYLCTNKLTDVARVSGDDICAFNGAFGYLYTVDSYNSGLLSIPLPSTISQLTVDEGFTGLAFIPDDSGRLLTLSGIPSPELWTIPTLDALPAAGPNNNGMVSDGTGDWYSHPIVNSNIAGDGITVSSATGNVTISRKLFTSADQVITAAGSLTIAHALPAIPKGVHAALVCQTGEANYTAGDVVFYGQQPVGTNSGYSCTVDATNLNIRFGSDAATFWLPDKTSGVGTALTNTKWKIRFYAD